MTRPRKGRRLAVSLPIRFPSRSLSFALAAAVTAAYLAPAYYFIYGTREEVHRKWLVAIVVGAFGMVCAAGLVREFLRWYLAGDTTVEISAWPATLGQPLRCFVLQDRDHSWIRNLRARLVCYRTDARGGPQELLSLPVGDGQVEREGRRARLEGTVQLPQDAPASEPFKIRWSVVVRVEFGRTLVLTEEHPLTVVK